MRSACLYGSSPGLCWTQVVPMLSQVGPMLKPSWAHLGLMLGQVGPMLSHRAHLGPIYWAYILGRVGPMLGHVGLCWAHLGPMLGLCWAYVGPTLAYVSPMLAAHVGPSWDLCWGHVWDIYVETILRCQFFRPGPPPGAQNHVKTGLKHRKKKKYFLTPRVKYTVNYRGFSWHGVGSPGVSTGWVGGRGFSAYNLRLPTEGPPARTQAALARHPHLKADAWQPGAGQATTFGLWRGKIGPRFSAQTQGRAMLNWGRHNAQCLPVWKQSGPMLSAGYAHVELNQAHVEPSCAHLGLVLGQVGPMLSHRTHLGPMLAKVGPMLGYAGLILGQCWAYVGPMLAHIEPSWGAMLGPCLGHLCWSDLKMPILPPRPPPGAQNHVKTEVLQHHRQDEIPCRRTARNTVKNDAF